MFRNQKSLDLQNFLLRAEIEECYHHNILDYQEILDFHLITKHKELKNY